MRSAPAAMICREFFAQVCTQRWVQPGQTWSCRLSPSPLLAVAAYVPVGPTRARISSPICATKLSSSEGLTRSPFRVFLLDVRDLLHPREVPSAAERSREPGAQNLFRLAFGQKPAAECK